MAGRRPCAALLSVRWFARRGRCWQLMRATNGEMSSSDRRTLAAQRGGESRVREPQLSLPPTQSGYPLTTAGVDASLGRTLLLGFALLCVIGAHYTFKA